jgi:predicted alpha/beta-fold hydrolase
MPLIRNSTYRAPFGFGSGHIQTIYPSVFRRVENVTPRRKRVETPDGDFLDLDRGSAETTSNRAAILSHGLEGCSGQAYMQGMARALLRDGWDVIALNFRGCSGEPNRLPRSYHSGATEDLHTTVRHVLSSSACDSLALIGFSLGGNLTLKYLGDAGADIDPRVRGAVAFSVPCDLEACAARLSRWDNMIYLRRFLRYLKIKTRIKARMFPDIVSTEGLNGIRTFLEFDGRYTAPLHGFSSAEDYWRKCSCKPVLRNIRVPTLVLNARNDPFLPPECFPENECADSEFVHLETPDNGGHMGFVEWRPDGSYWSEARAVEFLRTATQTGSRDGVDVAAVT